MPYVLGGLDLSAMIPLVALLISVMTFVSSQVVQKRMATNGRVETLEQRVLRLEAEVEKCETDRHRLMNENIALRRKLERRH